MQEHVVGVNVAGVVQRGIHGIWERRWVVERVSALTCEVVRGDCGRAKRRMPRHTR